MANVFSHPVYFPNGNWTVVSYSLVVSRAINNSPSYFGPWVPLTGYTSYTQNTDIVDATGTYWDLYRVAPTIAVNMPNGTVSTVTLDYSKPFQASTPLYDSQISSLIDNFRQNYISDVGVEQRDSTLPQESTGGAIAPFITDSLTSRFYLSFLPNDSPLKVDADRTIVFTGTSQTSASPLAQYSDYYASEKGGYIDFATIPSTSSYLRVDYRMYRFTQDEVRNALLNAVSSISLYGINGYEVRTSNNLYYLVAPLPTRDLAEIACQIAYRNLLNAQVQDSLENAEAWKDGKIEYTSDPSRSLQAATIHINNLDDIIRDKANSYIYNTRTYLSRGEFTSYFDTQGILPLYSVLVAGLGVGSYAGFWI